MSDNIAGLEINGFNRYRFGCCANCLDFLQFQIEDDETDIDFGDHPFNETFEAMDDTKYHTTSGN